MGIRTQTKDRDFWTEVKGKMISSQVSSGTMKDEEKTVEAQNRLLKSEKQCEAAKLFN